MLLFGKHSLIEGIDFPLLRMRIAYAAFVTGNYSECLKNYEEVLEKDPNNETAIYYCYLSNINLNKINSAGYYASKLSPSTRSILQIKKIKPLSVQLETAHKSMSDATRGNATYYRIGAEVQSGFRMYVSCSRAWYNQLISEPAFKAVRDSQHINIDQKEWYGRIAFSATERISLIGAFHYLFTPFNNFVYHNKVLLTGIKYHSPYADFQLTGNFANLADSSFNQYDVSVTTYPSGNLKFYTLSRISYGTDFTFSQTAGFGLSSNVWLEGNVTAGTYRKLIENDALYVYNDIDTKKLKTGATLYFLLFKKLTATINYTWDRKLKIFTSNNSFNQHSFNCSLSWKF